MQILDKYLKLISEKKSQRDVIHNYLSVEIGLNDFNFDIVGDTVKLECSSQDRFMLRLRQEEWFEFLKENNLKLK